MDLQEISMADDRPANPAAAAAAKPAAPGGADDAYAQLRRIAGVGYQLRAAVRAGDRFLAQDSADDRNTGVWLVSTAVTLADDIKTDIDGLARTWKPRASDAPIAAALTKLRTRAHQLHAAARAADHFLDQEGGEDRSTGSWLVACALGLADKLAGEAEDLASALKRALGESPAASAASPDGNAQRRSAGPTPVRV
jgi:hypothetical protein